MNLNGIGTNIVREPFFEKNNFKIFTFKPEYATKIGIEATEGKNNLYLHGRSSTSSLNP